MTPTMLKLFLVVKELFMSHLQNKFQFQNPEKTEREIERNKV